MKLPKSYRGQGRHLFCTKHKCAKLVTNDKTRCGHKDVLAKNCPFKEFHVYQSRVYNPFTGQSDLTKLWSKLKNPEEFLIEHARYKQELKDNDYNVVKSEVKAKPYLLHELINKYVDYLKDIGVPEHSKKHRSSQYIADETRHIKVFLKVISTEFRLNQILVTSVNDHMVELLYNYLNLQDYKPRTWNAHFNSMTIFFNWLINHEGYDLKNPFKRVKRRSEAKDPQIIEESEFELLITHINRENGFQIIGKNKERKQRYKEWLIQWFYLSVFTGGRRQDISLMRCGHVHDNYIEIPNHKVNAKENTTINKSYPPMIASLHQLCLSLRVYDRDPEEYIICPDQENRAKLADEATKGFTHFWKLTGIDKHITLHSLRRTYITRMIITKGEKGAGVLHKDLDTAYKHYFSKKEANKDLVGEDLFDIDISSLQS